MSALDSMRSAFAEMGRGDGRIPKRCPSCREIKFESEGSENCWFEGSSGGSGTTIICSNCEKRYMWVPGLGLMDSGEMVVNLTPKGTRGVEGIPTNVDLVNPNKRLWQFWRR